MAEQVRGALYDGHFRTLIGISAYMDECKRAANPFIQASSIAPLQVHCYSEALSWHSMDTVSEFHAEAPQATASEGLA